MAKSPACPEMTDAQAALGSPPLKLPPQQRILTPEQPNPKKRASLGVSKEAPPAKRTKSAGVAKVATKPERAFRTFKRVTAQKPAQKSKPRYASTPAPLMPPPLSTSEMHFACRSTTAKTKKSIETPKRRITRSQTGRSLRSGAKRSTKKLTIPSEFKLSTNQRTSKKADR